MKACPHCGAQISDTAKFCSECGYNFENGVAPTKTQLKDFWIKLVPNILFFVFSVLLFGVLAEPVMSGLIGINVYSLCDSTLVNVAALSALAVVLVMFAGLTMVVAVCTVVVKYLEYKNGNPVNCKTDWISFGCYALFFVFGIILFAVVASEETVLMGACPIWLIVLPIIFACLLGAFKAYIRYNATPTATVVQPIADSTPSKQEQNIEESERPSKQEKNDGKAVQRNKKLKALLPSILLLVVAAAMWALYALPSVRVTTYDEFGNYWSTYYLSIYDINFYNVHPVTETFINIFQYMFIGYSSIVTILSVVLLVWSIMHIKNDIDVTVGVCKKTLLAMLIVYCIFFVIALAWMLFGMIGATWFDVGSVAIVAIAAIAVIGTIIAMVKFKKKLKQQATNSLE